tara:strand:+ start:2428 stop:3003 length:576 start_codon:yes stop_codon:yes gene_type:complete
MTELSAVSKLALESALTEPSAYTEIKNVLEKKVIRQSSDDNTARTLTVEESGAYVLLDENEAYTITLPEITASDIGTTFTFIETVVSNNLRSIVTAYDNDYYVGAVANLFDGAKTDGSTGGKALAVPGGTTTTIKFDDDLNNAGGSLGSWVTVTAILTGNVAASGGAKLVWAVQGVMAAKTENGTGAAFFA